MVETYGSDEQRLYYITEDVFGTTPTNPAMLSVPADVIDPGRALIGFNASSNRSYL